MNKEQLIRIVSLYKEDIPELKITDLGKTVTVSNNNITATFVANEMETNTVHEVLNHIIGADYDGNDDDVFRVIIVPTSVDHLKVDEKITVLGDAATLTASADFNGMIIELYSIFVAGSRRSITFQDTITVDSISRFEPWVMLEFNVNIADLIAAKLASITNISANDFRNIEFLNGSKDAITSCINTVEKEGGKLFCKIDIANRTCDYGYNHYNNENKTFEPHWEFCCLW